MLFKKTFFVTALLLLLVSCDDNLLPYYNAQEPGQVIINAYSALDSVQVIVNNKPIEINEKTAFLRNINTNYDFVYYNDEVKNIDIVIKETGQVVKSYSFTNLKPFDNLSFYYKSDTYIDEVLRYKKSILSEEGNTGYKFIFPTMNHYSQTNYNGALDGIIYNTAGETLGVVQNITEDEFSSFTQFPFSSSPIIKMELVKHGTTQSYVPGRQVMVTMVMQANKSRMIVLEEKNNDNGGFTGVEGIIDLTDYFEFETE